MLECNKPIVGAINGVAAGIGVQMALACDLLVAAEDARFVQVFARRGIVPDGGAAFLLPRLVGLNRAKELLFLGDDLGAADAERIGLVNRVVPGDELDGHDTGAGASIGLGTDAGNRLDQGVDPSIAHRRPRDEPRARSVLPSSQRSYGRRA